MGRKVCCIVNFEKFKDEFQRIARPAGIKVTDEELVKLFIAQIVVTKYQEKKIKKDVKRKKEEGRYG